jgi:hypothetical protein
VPELAALGHRSDIREVEARLLGIGAAPSVGIGQRGLLVQTERGNLLWDPPGFVDDAALDAVRRLGGLAAVTASHPHFYGTIVEWSRAFGAEILIPAADRAWVTRPDPAIRLWSDRAEVLPGVAIIQCGGHFDGSAVLHWADGADGRGALLAGDTIMVTPGEDRVTFLRSAPNRLPLPESEVRRVLNAVDGLGYDRVYSGWWTPTVHQNAQSIVRQAGRRYIQWLTGEALASAAQPEGDGPAGTLRSAAGKVYRVRASRPPSSAPSVPPKLGRCQTPRRSLRAASTHPSARASRSGSVPPRGRIHGTRYYG